MSTVFSQAALVTFGSARSVLAYVTQAVTPGPYNWLTVGQAVDGLALAETTPATEYQARFGPGVTRINQSDCPQAGKYK